MPDLPTGYVAHAMAGRLRIRVPDRRYEEEYFVEAAHELGTCRGVSAVEANARTASLLVLHGTTVEAIARHGAERGQFALHMGPPPVQPLLPPAARLMDGAVAINRRLLRATQGQTDMGGVLAVLMLLVAFVQAARGQIAVPAMTAFWYALNALLIGKQMSAEPQPPAEESEHV